MPKSENPGSSNSQIVLLEKYRLQLKKTVDPFSREGLVRGIAALETMIDNPSSPCFVSTVMFTHKLRTGDIAITRDQLRSKASFVATKYHQQMQFLEIPSSQLTPPTLSKIINGCSSGWFALAKSRELGHVLGVRYDGRYPKFQVWDSDADLDYMKKNDHNPHLTIMDIGEFHSRLKRQHLYPQMPVIAITFS